MYIKTEGSSEFSHSIRQIAYTIKYKNNHLSLLRA
jgi:hypothetical protein